MTDTKNTAIPEVYSHIERRVVNGDTNMFNIALDYAEKGDRYAQLLVGFFYAKGHCVKQNNRIASKWYQKSAAQGVANAQFNLGCLSHLGLGCKRSATDALFWFQTAADNGHEVAKKNLESAKMAVTLIAEEQLYLSSLGINKIAGIVDNELARGYCIELDELLSDEEIKNGLVTFASNGRYSLARAADVEYAITLIHNISSATNLSVDNILSQVISGKAIS